MSRIELDSADKRILIALQGDLDDSSEPYAAIARDLDLTEHDVISRIRRLLDQGVIRRIGAMIRHIEAGIGFNGMVVWSVEPERVESVGNTLATFPEVTHCYERPPFGKKAGSLFTMVHAASEKDCLDIIRRMSEQAQVTEYEILFSRRELKKTSMIYFDENDPDDP